MTSPFERYAAHLIKGGYSPIPLFGKRPIMNEWDHLKSKALTLDELVDLNRKHRNLNLGVAGGYNCLVPIDVDTEDREIQRAVLSVLPKVMVAKSGQRGFTTFFWDSSGMIDGRKFKRPKQGGGWDMLVEVLVTGQTVIPPSVHPDTGLAYRWRTERTLLNTRVDELPEITPAHIEAMAEVLKRWMPQPKPFTPRIVAEGTPHASDKRMASYARTILANEVRLLAGMQKDSGRNLQLFNAICKLGKFVHHGVISEGEVWNRLAGACQSNGLWQERDCGPKGCQATFKSGLGNAVNDPLPVLENRVRAA